MRIWTASFKSPEKFTTVSRFYDMIIVPNGITHVIDIRRDYIKSDKFMAPKLIEEEFRIRHISYTLLGNYYFNVKDPITYDNLKLLLSEYKEADNATNVITRAVAKYNVCLIGSKRKHKQDLRYELAYIIADRVKDMFNEKLFIMHTGE